MRACSILSVRSSPPPHSGRSTLHTGTSLLTTKQQERIAELFADPNYTEVEVTWSVYQDIVTAYRNEDNSEGQRLLQAVIDALSSGLPTGLVELKRLGRTLKRRAADVLAFFTRPGTPNGPTESISGRLEHPRGSALGFRNLAHYIARCLLESGGFRPVLHSRLRRVESPGIRPLEVLREHKAGPRTRHGPRPCSQADYSGEFAQYPSCCGDSGFDGTVDTDPVPSLRVVCSGEVHTGVGVMEVRPAVDELP